LVMLNFRRNGSTPYSSSRARLGGVKKIGAFKTQHTARAATDALPAGEAITVLDGLAEPGVTAHIYLDGAAIGADATLHATQRVRCDMPLIERLTAQIFAMKQTI
jgi:hypothetical protein